METVYLLLGTNLGDRMANLGSCLERLKSIGTVSSRSSIYETKAWGNQEQPDFLNQAIAIQTEAKPEAVLSEILDIETELGRVREEKWSSRVIDIDILLFGGKIIESENLKIPHPLLHERRFVLSPLMEIAPDFIHPILNKSIKELWGECSDRLKVEKIIQ